jgi:cytosine/adenosine deaminase-related metal-dependent hydrolase
MKDSLAAVSLLGEQAGTWFDIAIDNGMISAIAPTSAATARRLLAMPALVNAHDHARPLSPTSFGGGGKPLEAWLLQLGAMPAVNPYNAALAAFGRAARGGAGSIMAHYTRFLGPMPPVDEAREIARAASDIGIRVTLAVFMRDRNPLVYGPDKDLLKRLPQDVSAIIDQQFCRPMPSVRQQIDRVEAIAAAVESPTFSVQFGPNGPQWCSDELLRAIAQNSSRTGRRIHMHFLETLYQRAFADREYPEGIVSRFTSLGLLSPRLTLAHCVHARIGEFEAIAASGVVIATNPSSNLHLRSGIAPIATAIKAGCRVALGIDASAFDEDDDILRETRLAHFLHGGWGFEIAINREDWLAGAVAAGRLANGAPGVGRLEIGAAADILVLDLDRLDRDAIMPIAPIDLLFARAAAAHVVHLLVGGRWIVRDGSLTGADLDAVHSNLRAEYRRGMSERQLFLQACQSLQPAVAGYYRDWMGCC